MHREYIAKDTTLLKNLKAKGIKTYVWFTLREIDGIKPEEYIWENDMDYCFGMYANRLIDISQKNFRENSKKRHDENNPTQ
jgi:hypothetical protein